MVCMSDIALVGTSTDQLLDPEQPVSADDWYPTQEAEFDDYPGMEAQDDEGEGMNRLLGKYNIFE